MAGRHRKGGPASDEVELAAGTTTAAPEQEPDPGAPAPPPIAPARQVALARPQVDLVPPVRAFAAPVGTGSAAEAAPVLPAGASVRRAVREQHRRRSRRIRIGAVVAAAAVASFGAFFVLGGGDGAPTRSVGPAQRNQTTLLLQVVDGQQQTVASALLAHDSRGQGTGFGALIPSALVVNVPGSGSAEFGTTSAGGARDSAGLALSDTLGVTVDGTWVLDLAGLAQLVDSVGGVDVTVDRDVTVAVPGGTQLVTAAGEHHLAGAAAAAFATFLGPQEPEQSRLARFSTVLGAVLSRLPADAKARAALLATLSVHSSSTVSGSALDTVLGGLRSDAVGQRMSFDTLPARSLDLGTGSPALLVDPGPTQTLLKNNFAGSLPIRRAGGDIRVVVQNGVGTPGLSAKARAKLLVAGLTYVGGGNAGESGYPQSQVLVTSDSGSAGLDQARVVARALGLPAKDVLFTDQGQTIADVVVILGADFKP